MCTELNIIRSVLRIEPTSSLFTQPAKRTNEFSNQTCVIIRPTCLTLSLNKKFEATLTHDIGRIYTRDELPDAEFILEDDLPISDDLASWDR